MTVENDTNSDDEEIVISPDDEIDKGGKRKESAKDARARRDRASADREEFNRDIAKIERDQMRGKLVTAKEAKAAAAEIRDTFLALGKQLWPRTDALLGDSLPASDRQRVAQAMRQAWADLLAELSL